MDGPGLDGGDRRRATASDPSPRHLARLPPFRCFQIRDVAAALSYLHCVGVVHGDLSSNNVLLRCTGHGCAHVGSRRRARVHAQHQAGHSLPAS